MAKQEIPINITQITPHTLQYARYSWMLKPSGNNTVDFLDDIQFLINISFLLCVSGNLIFQLLCFFYFLYMYLSPVL